MKKALDWLKANDAQLLRNLERLVAIPSISTDGEHQYEIDQTAALTCEQMRAAGLNNVSVLRSGNSNPYAYGEWLGAPGKPTVFLYAHHDVQPINYVEQWKSDPWKLTERDGRVFGRGSADDKAAIVVQLGAIASYLQTQGSLPVNVKVLVEGEEEVGSRNLHTFFKEHREKLLSDVIVVCDTGNLETGLPCITYSLRGIVSLLVEVQTAELPTHSGTAGGMLADAALALNVVLSRLFWKNKKLPIPGFYDKVRPLTPSERRTFKKLPGDDETWRKVLGVLPGVDFACIAKTHPYEQTWRQPAVTVIAQEASSIKGASNQVLPRAAAVVSCRLVPDQDPDEAFEQIKAVLVKDPPWNARVTVTKRDACKWWITDPNGPAFEAAMKALKKGFEKKPMAIGCGGSIGFVGPLAELFNDAPALLLGIEDPLSNAHAPNESLDLGDFRKLTASLAHLFQNLADIPDGKVKAAPKPKEETPAPAPEEPVAAGSSSI
jgi:acetylornithine deacetylase/succinyl-diaminopimelate desuccinylase-like protein